MSQISGNFFKKLGKWVRGHVGVLRPHGAWGSVVHHGEEGRLSGKRGHARGGRREGGHSRGAGVGRGGPPEGGR